MIRVDVRITMKGTVRHRPLMILPVLLGAYASRRRSAPPKQGLGSSTQRRSPKGAYDTRFGRADGGQWFRGGGRLPTSFLFKLKAIALWMEKSKVFLLFIRVLQRRLYVCTRYVPVRRPH